jgi:hypothetical protein
MFVVARKASLLRGFSTLFAFGGLYCFASDYITPFEPICALTGAFSVYTVDRAAKTVYNIGRITEVNV